MSYIYLWELDSVRNSREECIKARKVLYNQLLIEGNVVILSYNQLTDATWMTQMLEDEEQFNAILELIKIGAIKVTSYVRPSDNQVVRTASQYIQGALTKALDGNSDFLFSGMPIKGEEKHLLREVRYVVQYCDPDRLLVDIEHIKILKDKYLNKTKYPKLIKKIKKTKKQISKKKEDLVSVSFELQLCIYYYEKGVRDSIQIMILSLDYEIKRLLLIHRYIKLILAISLEQTVNNEANRDAATLTEIIKSVYKLRENIYEEASTEWKDLFKKAVKDLYSIECTENRSEWYKQINNRSLKASKEKKCCDFQKLMVDVCYNFAVESSTDYVFCPYDVEDKNIFIDSFVKRMNEYYQSYKDGIHRIEQINEPWCSEGDNLDWNRVVEVRRDVESYMLQNRTYGSREKEVAWNERVRNIEFILPIKRVIIFIFLFLVVNLSLGELQKWLEDLINNTDWLQIVNWWKEGGTMSMRSLLNRVYQWSSCSLLYMIVQIFCRGGLKKIVDWIVLCKWNVIFAIVGAILFGIISSIIENVFEIPDILEAGRTFIHKIGIWKKQKQDLKNISEELNQKTWVKTKTI